MRLPPKAKLTLRTVFGGLPLFSPSFLYSLTPVKRETTDIRGIIKLIKHNVFTISFPDNISGNFGQYTELCEGVS